MKTTLLAFICTFSLSALAGPIFQLENLSFLYTEQDLSITNVATYDPNNPNVANKVRVYQSLEALIPVNSGTQLDSSYLGYDINNIGALWLTDNLDVYGTLLNGQSGPVKLVDGSVIQSIGSNQPYDEINGLLSYGVDQSVGDFYDLGSPYPNPSLPIEGYVYGEVQSINDFLFDCQVFQICGGYDLVGLQYFDSTDDGFFNGDFLYVSKDKNGFIKDSAIFAYNLGVNEISTAFTLEELGITPDIAPTRGLTFFNKSMFSLPGVEQPPVEVSEPSTIGLLTIGTVAFAAARKGVVKAVCKKSGLCVLINTMTKKLVGTAKAKK